MAKSSFQKSIGTAICAFFGIITFGSIFQLITNKFDLYNPSITPIIWIVYDILCCIVMAYIATKKNMVIELLGRVGAGILALVFAIFTINLLLSFFDINIYNSIGQYFGIAVGIIQIIAAALLFLNIKAWLPVKISATLYWLPGLCSSFFYAKVKDAFELAEKTSDYSVVERIFNATAICEYFSLALSILTIVLTIVWLTKKPLAPHAQSNPIDII